MKTTLLLPDRYECTKDIRVTGVHRTLNICAFVCSVALLVLGWLWRSLDALSDLLMQGIGSYLLWALLLIAALFAYQLVHQLTHGLLLRLWSGVPSLYAWRGTSLFVGSEAYFSRGAMLAAVLLPMLVWSAAGLVCAAALQAMAFWFAWFCVVLNLGGSMNDLYFALQVCKQPRGAVFQYRGYAVRVFTEENV